MMNKDVIYLLLNQIVMVNNEIEDKILYQERLINQLKEYILKNSSSPNETALEFMMRRKDNKRN